MADNERPKVAIFCDGACKPNPGQGGWGAILVCGGREKELSGGAEMTTNNRMELSGALIALQSLKKPCEVVLTSDSKYLTQGMSEWIYGWIRKGRFQSHEDPVVNSDLWQLLLVQSQIHTITWNWVRGHSGHRENERCDVLANEFIERARKTGDWLGDERNVSDSMYVASPQLQLDLSPPCPPKKIAGEKRVIEFLAALSHTSPTGQIRSVLETLGDTDTWYVFHAVKAIGELLSRIETEYAPAKVKKSRAKKDTADAAPKKQRTRRVKVDESAPKKAANG